MDERELERLGEGLTEDADGEEASSASPRSSHGRGRIRPECRRAGERLADAAHIVASARPADEARGRSQSVGRRRRGTAADGRLPYRRPAALRRRPANFLAGHAGQGPDRVFLPRAASASASLIGGFARVGVDCSAMDRRSLDSRPGYGEDGGMDKKELAEFLRHRRETLRPRDVGLVEGPRRRTQGLRREEVAQLAGMSTDYYARLEQQRAPQPSVQITTALARALRLSLDERDHLFVLVGHNAPARFQRSEHVSPPLMRVLDRLDDSPAMVQTDLFDTLAMNPLAVALLGDQTRHTGLARSGYYRWFMDSAERLMVPEETHERHGRAQAARLRAALTAGSDTPRAARILAELQEHSPEFVRTVGTSGGRPTLRRLQDHPPSRTRPHRRRRTGPVHREPRPDPGGADHSPRHGELQQTRTALRHRAPAAHPLTSWAGDGDRVRRKVAEQAGHGPGRRKSSQPEVRHRAHPAPHGSCPALCGQTCRAPVCPGSVGR
ncbi:hypothetical protein SPURM210S_04363 [Streptomyces purpurascens]